MWREPIESKAKVVKERCAKLSLSGPVWGGDDGYKGLDLYMYKCGGIL
jgi:hypothetical protein